MKKYFNLTDVVQKNKKILKKEWQVADILNCLHCY